MAWMKRWGFGLLAVSGVLVGVFAVLAIWNIDPLTRCPNPGERCLVRSVQTIDEPLLWLFSLGAGVAAAAGLFLLKLERTAPPERAVDATWEDFASEASR